MVAFSALLGLGVQMENEMYFPTSKILHQKHKDSQKTHIHSKKVAHFYKHIRLVAKFPRETKTQEWDCSSRMNSLEHTACLPLHFLHSQLAVPPFPCTDPSQEPLGTVNRVIINYVMQRGSKD